MRDIKVKPLMEIARLKAGAGRTVPAPRPVAGQEMPPRWISFCKQYLTTMRPYLFPVSGLAGLAGMSLAHTADRWRWGLALFVFSLSYGFGQALTDCFQQDTDRLSAPYRPLVQGRIAARHVLLVSLAGLVAGMAVLGWLNPWNLVVSGCTVIGLLVYTPLKRRWWAGPMANAWIVALLPLMGWLVGSGNSLLTLGRHPEVLVVATMSFAAYANFVLVGYLKDVKADRQTHYNTLPVRFGRMSTVLVSHFWAVGALTAGLWAVGRRASLPQPHSLLAVAVFLCAALLSATTQITLHRISREDEVHRPMAGVARVFLLLHIAVVASRSPGWLPLAAVFYVAFEVLLSMRPERRQI